MIFRFFLILFSVSVHLCAAELRVATYNVCNYLSTDRKVDGVFYKNYPKPEREKTALRQIIKDANADVLALQEIGGVEYLNELQRDLKQEGCDYPHVALIIDKTCERNIAILSKWPLENIKKHVFNFDYFGRDASVKRGLLEATLKVGEQKLILYVVHLKSRLSSEIKDPKSKYFRESEAQLIRDYLVKIYENADDALYCVVGDFNDVPKSATLRTFLRYNKRPFLYAVEAIDKRGDDWTHYNIAAGTYSRSDYILISKSLQKHVANDRCSVVENAAARVASDHRLVYATFIFGGNF